MSAQRVAMGSRDLISSLPDEILGKILSLLWTNRAACTSVLSKRWRYLLAFVDNLDLRDASCGSCGFCDFVDKTLALLSNSPTFKRFSLTLTYSSNYDYSRVDSWIRTVLECGCLEIHLENHCIATQFFKSNTLVELSICNAVYPKGPRLPRGTLIFPALKTLSLMCVEFEDVDMYEDFISGCPLLDDLSLHYDNDDELPAWDGLVSSPSMKRLTIYHNFPTQSYEVHGLVCFETPSLVYLDYSSYAAQQYEVDLASLVEARLNVKSWVQLKDDTEDDDSDSHSAEDDVETEDDFGDVTDLVAGISNVITLHLSPDSLEAFHLCCESMPVFHNLSTLCFGSDKEIGWQVVPLLINNSPNLETLVIEGLVHRVTDECGDACACIPKKKRKREEECCLSTCKVKVLTVSGYRGSCQEGKQMRHFLANLKCLETVNLGVKVSRRQKDKNANDRYLRITNALTKLPRVSSKCKLVFF